MQASLNAQVELHTVIHGTGMPLVLLHGGRLDHRMMTAGIEPVFQNRDGWQRIYFDLPGMGESVAPDWMNCSDHVLDCVIGNIGRVLGDRPFAVAGMSYGGYMTQGLVHRLGHRLLGACFIAPGLDNGGVQRTLPEPHYFIEEAGLLDDVPAPIRDVFQMVMTVQNREIVDTVQELYLPAILRSNTAFRARLVEPGHYRFAEDVYQLPRPFAKPALFITGRLDNVTGYADALSLHDQFPRATLVAMDRAGHGVMLEYPDLFHTLFQDWLFRMEEALQ